MVNMQLVFLGTSSAAPTVHRGLSSIALLRGSELLLFDAGEGMQRNFLKAGLGTNKKMKVFISHMHADHCVGLLGLLQTMALQGRVRQVDVYGEPRVKEFLKENMRIINFGLTFEVGVNTIEKEGLVVRETDYEVRCCEASHSVLSYAYCIEEFNRPGVFNVDEAIRLSIPKGELYRKLQQGQDILVEGRLIKSNQVVGPPRSGRKVGISGDTRPTEKLEHFFKGCDVLVFESTYGNERRQKAIENWHATAAEAAELATRASAGKLILTHFSARYDETLSLVAEASATHKNVEAAEDLKIVDIPYPENAGNG